MQDDSIQAADSRAWAKRWREKTVNAQQMSPGLFKTWDEARFLRPSSRGGADQAREHGARPDVRDMSSLRMGSWLADALGPAGSAGLPGQAKLRLHAFEFRSRIILAIGQMGKDTVWHVALDDAADPEITGAAPRKPLLLSADPAIVDFWPDFCMILAKAAIRPGEEFKAAMEADQIARACLGGASGSRVPRI